MRCKAAPYGGMQNCSYGEKEKSRKSTAKDTMVETEECFKHKTAGMLRNTAETVLGVKFGKQKRDKETWWWNEEVQESIKKSKKQRKHGTK